MSEEYPFEIYKINFKKIFVGEKGNYMSEDTKKIQTVIRIVHNRENPFVQLNKATLWDKRLSLKAVGLLARCMSKPTDWKFSISQLASSCKEGRASIDSAIKELEEAGYVVRFEYSKKNEKGQFVAGSVGIEYFFFEYPATAEDKASALEDLKKVYHDCTFRDCGNRNCGNRALLIKKATTDTDKRKKYKDICADFVDAKEPSFVEPDKPVEKKTEKSEGVFVTDEEHRKLVEKFGMDKTLEGYEEYSLWKKSADPKQVKKHASDYYRLRKWAIPDLMPKENKQKPTERKFAPSSPQTILQSKQFERWMKNSV